MWRGMARQGVAKMLKASCLTWLSDFLARLLLKDGRKGKERKVMVIYGNVGFGGLQ